MAILSNHVRVGINFASSADWVHAYFTVDPNNLIVGRWHLLRPEIIRVIKELPWAILSVVRCSYCPPLQRDLESNALILNDFEASEPKPESNPVILVGAPAESRASWQTLAERIYFICSDNGFVDIRVLFESVQYPLTATYPLAHSMARFPKAEELAEIIPMGSGFGPVEKEVQTSASMGGTIKLQGNEREPLTLLLSVFHSFSRLVDKEELSQGCRHDPARPIHLKMPSVQDVSHEREYRQKEINQIKEKIALNGDKFQHTGEKRFSQIVIHLKNKLEMQQTSLRKLDDHTNDSQGLGELQYGSGLGRGLDWSLSSFSDRKIKNTPPEKDEVKVVMDAANMDFEEVDAALQRFGWSTEANISYPEIDGLVIKQGRSTGLTVGKVNALPSDVLISVPDLESISEPLNLRKDVGIEVRAILEKGNGFARKGDSGAWVLNMDSDWIGSIVGVQTPRTSGPGTSTALVLEAKKIVDDIETFSGMKVVSPGRLG